MIFVLGIENMKRARQASLPVTFPNPCPNIAYISIQLLCISMYDSECVSTYMYTLYLNSAYNSEENMSTGANNLTLSEYILVEVE